MLPVPVSIGSEGCGGPCALGEQRNWENVFINKIQASQKRGKSVISSFYSNDLRAGEWIDSNSSKTIVSLDELYEMVTERVQAPLVDSTRRFARISVMLNEER